VINVDGYKQQTIYQETFAEYMHRSGSYSKREMIKKQIIFNIAFAVHCVKRIPSAIYDLYSKYVYVPILWELNKNNELKITRKGIDYVKSKIK